MSKDDDVTAVWKFWASRQRRPDLCRLTADRRKLIADRLRLGYDPTDLIVLFRYAFEADEPRARFWRGDNDRGETYLGLDDLLRVTKLGDRVVRAHHWAEDQAGGSALLSLPIGAASSAPAVRTPVLEGSGRAGKFRSAKRSTD